MSGTFSKKDRDEKLFSLRFTYEYSSSAFKLRSSVDLLVSKSRYSFWLHWARVKNLAWTTASMYPWHFVRHVNPGSVFAPVHLMTSQKSVVPKSGYGMRITWEQFQKLMYNPPPHTNLKKKKKKEEAKWQAFFFF